MFSRWGDSIRLACPALLELRALGDEGCEALAAVGVEEVEQELVALGGELRGKDRQTRRR